jgi:hypothetical protein
MLCTFFKGNPSPDCQPWRFSSTASSPAVVFANVNAFTSTATQANHQTFDAISFMQQFNATMFVAQQSQTIVVELHAGKRRKSEAKVNNNMLQLLLVGGIGNFLSPGNFLKPRIPNNMQAMKNILLQPTSI